jgi:hypothetical protein
MYEEGDIPQESTELLDVYDCLGEYNIYKKYKDEFDGELFFFSDIQKKYEETKNKYKEYMSDKNSKEFNKVINSKLPFLFQNYSFDEIVKNYFGEDIHKLYRFLSIYIHPNDLYTSYPIMKNLDYESTIVNLFNELMKLAQKYYKDGYVTRPIEEVCFNIVNSPLSNKYKSFAYNQYEILIKISDMIANIDNTESSQTYFIRDIAGSIRSLAIDVLFGYPEIVKCKFKPIVEMMALNYYIATSSHCIDDKYIFDLIYLHTRVKYAEILEENIDEELKAAHIIYNAYVEKVDFEPFKKQFMSSVGFAVEKFSITKFVYRMIDDVEPDSHMREFTKMMYDEAQLLSHANGYMLRSNTGSFMGYNPAIVFIDKTMTLLLRIFHLNWKEFNETEGEKKFNKFVYDLNKNIKEFEKVGIEKAKFDLETISLKGPYNQFKKMI